MPAVTVELLEQLVAATAEAREAVREAHEARADLRGAIKDATEALGRVQRVVLHAADAVLADKVKELLDRIGYNELGARLQAMAVEWNEAITKAKAVVAQLEERARRL